MSRGHLTERELEEIQDRSRRAWNRLVAREEAETRALELGEPPTRPDLRLVKGGDSE